jgi:uncharacterized membrane protein YhaH (DUF805 family)
MAGPAATPATRSPWQWMIVPFARFAVIKGRAPRAEYWWFALLVVLIDGAASLVDFVLDNAFEKFGGNHGGFFTMIAAVVLILPQLTVSIRRLHDVDRSGWWLLAPAGIAFAAGIAAGATSGDVGGSGLSTATIALMVAAVAALVMIIVWSLMRGTVGDNRYGPDPLAV